MNLSDRLQAKLHRSYAHPDYGGWFWDWEVSLFYQLGLDLYSDEDADWTILTLIPIQAKKPLPYPLIPGPWYRNWAINIGADAPLLFVKGTLAEAKHQVDSLLASPSPPIPPFPSPEEWQRLGYNLPEIPG